jgi:PTS system nitrogen regulatory IIA component
MNSFTALVTLDDVLLDIHAPDGKAVFRAIAQAWERLRGLDAAHVAASLLAREKLGSTALGKGVAIPHARITGLRNALGAVVRPRRPIQFDSPDDQPVGHFFVLLVPEAATQRHLQILADAATMLAEARFRTCLEACMSPGAVCDLMASWTPAARGGAA